MVRLSIVCAAVLVGASLCVSPSSTHAGTTQKTNALPKSPRTVSSLDSGWQLYRMPDFDAWPGEPHLTSDQIPQLKLPSPGKGWEPVHLPDDYVVRGDFSREPNKSMLAGGTVYPLGSWVCEVPNGVPPAGKPGALNRAGRDEYAGHGYLPLYPAWYRRKLQIPAIDQGKNIWLDFGGVYRDAIVFVNLAPPNT